jgi:hypothetical protein
MLKFKNFLTETFIPENQIWEELLIEAKATSENDDMGKMFELRFLYHASHTDDNKKTMPEHHRSKGKEDPLHNGSPESVHSNILSRMDPKKAEMIDNAARASVDSWRKKYLKPGDEVARAVWSSNRDQINKKTGEEIPGDHFNTSGIHDPNSPADGMIHIKRKDGKMEWNNPSLKIGSQEPNLLNPGIDSMEKMTGHAKDEFADMEKPHIDNMTNNQTHKYSAQSREDRHAQWKIDKLAGDEGIDAVRNNLADIQKRKAAGEKIELKERKYETHAQTFIDGHDTLKSDSDRKQMLDKAKYRAQSAVDSNMQVRKAMSTKFTNGLSKQSKPIMNKNGEPHETDLDDNELRATLNKSFSPQTKLKSSIVHAKLDGKGGFEPKVDDLDTYASTHLNRFANLRAVGGDGISTYIKGHLKDEKGGYVLDKKGKPKLMNVAQFNIKNNSGPMNNIVGSAKILNKRGSTVEE